VKKKTPHLKKKSPKRERKEEEITISLSTTQCLLITIICLAIPLILSYPLAELPISMELIIINEAFHKKITYILSHLRYGKLFVIV
jgi:hypothetical protein